MSTATCTGTTGQQIEISFAERQRRAIYNRLECTTCGGYVFAKANGTLRKHTVGSNRSS